MIDLWSPHAAQFASIAAVLATALALGMVHGVTPDEHTWPITFSYAVGSYSTRGGMRAGLLFSLAFALQRAIASELAYFALVRLLEWERWEYIIYIVVGAVMAGSGAYLLRRGRVLHLFHSHAVDSGVDADSPASDARYFGLMPLLHGFIAGWGTGAFALIVYTVLAPSMPSPWLAFLPGLVFGLGTMLMQIAFGAAIGAWAARRRLSEHALKIFARRVSGETLAYGGLAFVLVGLFGTIVPGAFAWSFATGIHVHNLAHLGIGFALVAVIVVGIAGSSAYRALRAANAADTPVQ